MAYEAASALAYERLFRHAALSPALAASLDDGAAIDAARYDVAREDAKRIRAAVAITMAKLDAVLAPAAAWSRRHRRSRILPALDAAAAALSHPTGRVRAARHADRRPVGRRAALRCSSARDRPLRRGALVMRKGKPPPPCARQDPQTSRPYPQGRPLGPSRPHNGE